MKTYARVVNGTIVEIFPPIFYEFDSPEGCEFEFKKGDEVPFERRFHADVVAQCIDISNVTPTPTIGDTIVRN
jgi:hypothetical protein